MAPLQQKRSVYEIVKHQFVCPRVGEKMLDLFAQYRYNKKKGGAAMIWYVEDDPGIRDLVIYTLNATGFETRSFETGDECWKALQSGMPELLLLDGMLPGMDGVELLQKMKQDPCLREIPVIMASARGAEFDKIRSLDLGADDYLVKPFGMLELVSRVKAVLRRCGGEKKEPLLQMDGLVLNPREHTVTVDGERVQLTYKEYELLKLFLSNPGVAFTRDQLLERVWDSDYLGQTRTVDMHIRTLRQKLAPYADRIETVRNVGYRLEGRHDG